MPDTIIRELPQDQGGTLIEYRRNPDPDAFGCRRIQSRVLQPDGNPYPDGMWWDESAEGWMILRRFSPETLRALLPDLRDSTTLTPRG